MKKFFILFAFISIFGTMQAQFETIGARLGFGLELSAQFKTGSGRTEGDLGIYRNYSEITLGYHFVNNLGNDFNWYYGAGATVGIASADGLSAGPVGILGIEYNFRSVPLQLSIDYRPEFLLITNGKVDFSTNLSAAGIGIRYRF
jgi:hypothetical protein